jgi:hypothetical protein
MRPWPVHTTVLTYFDFDTALRILYLNKKKLLVKKEKNGVSEVITPWGRRTMFIKSKQRGLYFFSMVRRDVEKFIKDYEVPDLKDLYGVVCTPRSVNKKFSGKGKLALTDIKHAYWRIARTNEIISDATYNRGIKKEYKEVRNKALATMGTEKKYELYRQRKTRDGFEPTGEMVVYRPKNEEIRKVYEFIRHRCYKMMYDLSHLLGKDWSEYNTDGITYLDTPKNRKLVERYLTKENMLFRTTIAKKKPVSCGGPGVKSDTKKLGRESGIKLKKK